MNRSLVERETVERKKRKALSCASSNAVLITVNQQGPISWNAKDRHRINSPTGDKGFTFTGDQRLFAESTMRLALHFTLFSDGAKHCSFPVNFPTREIDWQITILLTDDRQDNYKRAEWLEASSPLFPFLFLALSSPNREPVHRLCISYFPLQMNV